MYTVPTQLNHYGRSKSVVDRKINEINIKMESLCLQLGTCVWYFPRHHSALIYSYYIMKQNALIIFQCCYICAIYALCKKWMPHLKIMFMSHILYPIMVWIHNNLSTIILQFYVLSAKITSKWMTDNTYICMYYWRTSSCDIWKMIYNKYIN